ncbi:MAG TPA: superoxide dismutase [Kiritimatiellia bacterium]|nr:superoxide dismutase [Kiritimatiellia bacterium]
MFSRREVLRTLTLTSAAALAGRFGIGRAQAQTDGAPLVPPPAPSSATSHPFTLGPLPYAPEDLEPHIDTATMEIHYGKHHAAYVNNLNKAIGAYPDLMDHSVDALIRDLNALPEDIRIAVRNNGGGHANHTLFWNCLSPTGGGEPEGPLADAIQTELGGFDSFKDALSRAALTVFGSGWAWLSRDADGHLLVEALPNQDSPLMFGRTPLFGIDVWEHAYYLKYQNRRAEYVKAIWNVINWQAVGQNYIDAGTPAA